MYTKKELVGQTNFFMRDSLSLITLDGIIEVIYLVNSGFIEPARRVLTRATIKVY